MWLFKPFKGPLIAVLIASYGGERLLHTTQPRFTKHPSIQVEQLERMPMLLSIRTAGVLQAKQSRTLKAEFDGSVVQKNFREGQAVRQNDLLLEIARGSIATDYHAKQDAYENAKSDAAKLQKDLRLQKQLFKRGAISKRDVETTERDWMRAQQTLRSAQEAFSLAEERWNRHRFYAPFDGVIAKDWIAGADRVESGKDLFSIVDPTGCQAKVWIDELLLNNVKEGQRAAVLVQSQSAALIPAEVIQIGPQSEADSTTDVPVVLKLDAPAFQRLLPNVSVTARIVTGKSEAIVSVPLSAVATRDGIDGVWKITADHRLRFTPVTLGRSNPDRTEITAGVTEKEAIAVVAQPTFKDGMRVTTHD